MNCAVDDWPAPATPSTKITLATIARQPWTHAAPHTTPCATGATQHPFAGEAVALTRDLAALNSSVADELVIACDAWFRTAAKAQRVLAASLLSFAL